MGTPCAIAARQHSRAWCAARQRRAFTRPPHNPAYARGPFARAPRRGQAEGQGSSPARPLLVSGSLLVSTRCRGASDPNAFAGAMGLPPSVPTVRVPPSCAFACVAIAAPCGALRCSLGIGQVLRDHAAALRHGRWLWEPWYHRRPGLAFGLRHPAVASSPAAAFAAACGCRGRQGVARAAACGRCRRGGSATEACHVDGPDGSPLAIVEDPIRQIGHLCA